MKLSSLSATVMAKGMKSVLNYLHTFTVLKKQLILVKNFKSKKFSSPVFNALGEDGRWPIEIPPVFGKKNWNDRTTMYDPTRYCKR